MAYRNGAGALISLTFDDGLPCQIKNAIPALDSRGLKATFFTIAAERTEYDAAYRTDTWKAAIARGHEVGSHSLTHCKAATLNPITMTRETDGSRMWLTDKLGVFPETYCYPYTDAPAQYQAAVQRAGYIAARGGRGARADKYMEPGDGVNLLNVPCFHVGPETVHDHREWIDTAIRRGAWVVLMLHGVNEPGTWDNLTELHFSALVNSLEAAKRLGLATVTFAEGAKLYKGGRNL
jgi:peptidoglycan/xylan/chitin deacetylase (PgdA/CDA1 family)